MLKITGDDVRKYLDMARSFKQGCPIYDSHVHPIDVLFYNNRPAYRSRAGASCPERESTLPETGAITTGQEDEFRGEVDDRFKRAAQVLASKRKYQKAYPEHFRNHMDAAGVDVSLLLPIAPASGDMELPMALMGSLFGQDERFVIGCSVPNTVGVLQIHEFLSRMKSVFHARAVKLHPNITEIDLTTNQGKERAEAILDGCRKNDLALVVHGGRSNVLRNAGARAYGCVSNMQNIDWGLSGNAVVIAHGGAYECSPLELQQEILPVLTRLLSRHENLFTDLSGLDCEIQIQLLRKIGPDRIVFGSDALYSTPWKEAAKLIFSLERADCRVEECYLTMASETPARNLFKKKDNHVREFAHTAISNH